MHLCVWLCVCTFTCIHMRAQRPGNMRGSSSVVLPTVFWGQICCWIWNLSIPASLAVQFAVRSLFLPPRCWDEECWGFEPWSFCFHSKHCVHWAIWWPLGKDLKTPSNQSFFFFFYWSPLFFFFFNLEEGIGSWTICLSLWCAGSKLWSARKSKNFECQNDDPGGKFHTEPCLIHKITVLLENPLCTAHVRYINEFYL